MGSEIITFPKERSSRIGTLVGELGVETPQNLEAAARLSALTPDQADKKTLSFLQQCKIELRVQHRLEYPADGGFRRIPTIVQAFGQPLSDDQAAQLARFMTPAKQDDLEGWVAELAVVAPRRGEGEFSGALKLQAYTSRLKSYPADVAKAALLDHSWQFFPSWFELEKACESLVKFRRDLINQADLCDGSQPPVTPLPASEQIKRQRRGDQPRTYTPESEAHCKPRGPRPYVPDPSPAAANVDHLKEELRELEADKELAASQHGQAYAQSLIQRIAALEGPKPVNTNTTREAG